MRFLVYFVCKTNEIPRIQTEVLQLKESALNILELPGNTVVFAVVEAENVEMLYNTFSVFRVPNSEMEMLGLQHFGTGTLFFVGEEIFVDDKRCVLNRHLGGLMYLEGVENFKIIPEE